MDVLPTSIAENDYIGCRLNLFADNWTGAPKWIRSTILRGYHWRWIASPALTMPKHQNHSTLVQDLVEKLVAQGAIYLVENQPCFLSRIFAVPKSSGGSRLILNVSDLNRYIAIPKFKASNHTQFRDALIPPAWMTSIDIQDVYLHVPIRPNLYKFLALSYKNRLYFSKTKDLQRRRTNNRSPSPSL